MVIRAIALSLALLVGIGTIVPLATESVEAGKRKTKRYKKKKYRKYSKAWWRQYRAQQRRNRAMQARRRALRLQQLRQARRNAAAKQGDATAAKTSKVADKSPAMLPSGEPAPSGWQTGSLSGNEVQFSVDGGRGTAAISVVGPASGETVTSVVVAQSQANGRLNSRMFYFTEVAGRIYSVSTNTGVDAADRIAEESEKVINSLQPRTRPVQQAKSLE
jgi:ATPase subunit of ABC transporter with duplicated ATPase domains